MTAHDERDVAKVAEALAVAANVPFPGARQKRYARAVLDALDLPGRERRARADALREAASLIAAERHSEVRRLGAEKCSTSPLLSNWIGGFSAAEGVVTRRAAEIDPEEADDDA